jgi:hypothetical protein
MEESGFSNVTPQLRSLVESYCPVSMLSTISIENGFNVLRSAERLLPVKWTASPQQVQALHIKTTEQRCGKSYEAKL